MSRGPEVGNFRGGLLASLTSAPVALAAGGVTAALTVAAIALVNRPLRDYRTPPSESQDLHPVPCHEPEGDAV
ncbi:hypothetical protein GCM10020219_052650 [Nonomuraea dietziae]